MKTARPFLGFLLLVISVAGANAQSQSIGEKLLRPKPILLIEPDAPRSLPMQRVPVLYDQSGSGVFVRTKSSGVIYRAPIMGVIDK